MINPSRNTRPNRQCGRLSYERKLREQIILATIQVVITTIVTEVASTIQSPMGCSRVRDHLQYAQQLGGAPTAFPGI